MVPTARIIAIGDELLSGAISDVNCGYLARELGELGIQVERCSLVGDEQDRIGEEIGNAAGSADLVITTGGLGPTSDDITRDAYARLLQVNLYDDAESCRRMEEKYRERNIPLNKISARQSQFPVGAEVISNPAGTADSFRVRLLRGDGRESFAVALPGIPVEVKAIFAERLKPWIQETFSGAQVKASRVLKCFGLSESYIGTVIEESGLDGWVNVAYRPVYPEIWIKLTSRDDGRTPAEAERGLDAAAVKIRSTVGEEFFFTMDPDARLPDVVGMLLKERRLTVACAESCTGGLVAHEIVSRVGASEYFLGSVVSYSNRAKESYLAVNHELIGSVGTVSREVAERMAHSVRHQLGASIGVSVTGIAGPSGGTEGKPIGTVWIGVSSERRSEAHRFYLPFARNRFRQYCAALVLDLVRRDVLGLSMEWERR